MTRSTAKPELTWIAAALLVGALIALLALPPATIASTNDIVRDCAQDGDLDGKYSPGELQKAKRQLGSDVDQYSDCRYVIGQAINKFGSGTHSNTSAPVSPTASDRSAVEKALKHGGRSLKIGEEQVEPGGAGQLPPGASVPIFGSSFAHALPTSVWLLLTAIALTSLALLAPMILQRLKWLRSRLVRR